jgi:hypothetical protein
MNILPVLPMLLNALMGVTGQPQAQLNVPTSNNQMNPMMLMLLMIMMSKEKDGMGELLPLLLMQQMGVNPVQYTQDAKATIEQLKAQRDQLEATIKELEKK